jgi:hypothetical protein
MRTERQQEVTDPPEVFRALPPGHFYLFADPSFSFAVLGRPSTNPFKEGWIEGVVIRGWRVCNFCREPLYDVIEKLNGELQPPKRMLVITECPQAYKELSRWGRPLTQVRRSDCSRECERAA